MENIQDYLRADALELGNRILASHRLVEEIKSSLERGRKVQVYAVYTQKRDVTRRLESILAKEGIRVAVLTTQVHPRNVKPGTNVSCGLAFRS